MQKSGSYLGRNPQRKGNKIKEKKFRDNLYSELGLTVFPASKQENIFKNCAREYPMAYVRVRTSFHSDLDDWPKDHPIPFYFGLLLVTLGFLGSFGYNASSYLIQATAGRLFIWIRTGKLHTASPEAHMDEKRKNVGEQP